MNDTAAPTFTAAPSLSFATRFEQNMAFDARILFYFSVLPAGAIFIWMVLCRCLYPASSEHDNHHVKYAQVATSDEESRGEKAAGGGGRRGKDKL